MALSRGLRCCQRAFAWLPVLIIALVVLWSYYAYVCELCLGGRSSPFSSPLSACRRKRRCRQLWQPDEPALPMPEPAEAATQARLAAGRVTLSNPVEKVLASGEECIARVDSTLVIRYCDLAYLIIFHILFVLFVWTYWKSIFTLPVQPGKKYHMSYADKERYENEERPEVQRQILAEIARKLPVYTRTGNGGVRFCDRCQLIKPDRCHHCSVCAICVLKMDHHCPWVNNCIGFSNYKFFLLFLAYALLYCLYIAATVFKYFIKYWTGELTNGRSKFHVLFLLFVAVMFFVSLMFLFGYHCWLVSRNRSTLEAFSAPVFQNGPDKNGFNLGFVKNLQQVFGEEKKLWLLPIASSQGDGHFFPMRALCEAQNPLLANEEQWEDDGIDEEPHGKVTLKEISCVLTYSD
ncbi:hypothetical protein QYF61_004901 [Mycteria americana]|uniref:Palmitoyltransferase n=1 Tax=Mycteria americana TaxID=33587 RepID=A0AAN7MPV8_MYCAM|nr:hypothetical protein QYF61_004901 [Mycteria americana]